MQDPLGFGNFNSQALHTPTAAPVKAAPKQGLLGKIGSSIIQAPKYFLNTDIVNPVKELAAQATNNKAALANATQASNENLGLGAQGTNIGEALKRLTGNTAQLAATVVAPEAKGAGLVSKIAAGSKAGAVIGGGSALANDQSVLQGAALGAVGGGAIPVAGKILGATANKALGATEATATPTIGQKLSSAVLNKGNKIEAKLGSFAPGQKVGGQQLDTQASNDILNTLQNEGINKLGAPEKLEQVESKVKELGQAHGTLTDTNNTSLTDQEKQAITAEVNDRLTNPNNPKFQAGGSSPTVQKYANNYMNDINNADDLSALGRQKTGLDQNEINYKSATDAATNARNIAAKTTRNVINDFMNSKVPGLDAVNNRLSNLYQAKGALLNASGSLANKTTGAEGITGRILTSETAEQAKSAIAKGLQNTGKALGGQSKIEPVLGDINTADTAPTGKVSSVLGNIAGNPAVQKVATLGVAGAAGNPTPAVPELPSTTDTGTADTPDSSSVLGSDTSQSPSDNSSYPEANMLYDIERDPKNASTYESLYTLLNPKPPASETSLDATQQKEVTGGESAIALLQQYNDQIDSLTGGANGNIATGKISTLLGHYLPGALSTSAEKQAYSLESNKRDIAIQIATAISGGTKPSAQSVENIEGGLPSVNDPAQVRQDKVNNIVDRLKNTLQIYATPVSQLAGGITGQQTTNGTVGSNLDSILGSLTGQ